uniref:Uncharacterized protein n=1 Tax=Kalanchoe fedtschenkoi TaxID=63787 RepID=A0A7N0V2M7_KALFE
MSGALTWQANVPNNKNMLWFLRGEVRAGFIFCPAYPSAVCACLLFFSSHIPTPTLHSSSNCRASSIIITHLPTW